MPQPDTTHDAAPDALPWYARRRLVAAFLLVCAALIGWDLGGGSTPRESPAAASPEAVDLVTGEPGNGVFDLGDPRSVDRPTLIEAGRLPAGTRRVEIALDGARVAGGPPRRTGWTLRPAAVVPGDHEVRVSALDGRGRLLSSRERRYRVERSGPSAAVVGNRLVDETGAPLRLLGVNRPGLEFACSEGWGISDGPMDDEGFDRLVSFGGNVIRLPINAKCWLGSEDVKPELRGEVYRHAVREAVRRIRERGLRVIIDLHWSSPTGKQSGQEVMADAEHAIPFWRSIGREFRDDPSVLFDLYNEPHHITWKCWRDGCTTDEGWRAVGMQEMIDTLRATGAAQPILVGGIDWANDLSRWSQFRPVDPADQMVASVHIYPTLRCTDRACWERTITPVAAEVPVLIGEFGSKDCRQEFARAVMDYADDHGINWTAWAWHPGDCKAFPSLIESWDGEPTVWGKAVKQRLAQRS